jgi:hypothetical protein
VEGKAKAARNTWKGGNWALLRVLARLLEAQQSESHLPPGCQRPLERSKPDD